MARSATPMRTHPCPACGKLTRAEDGHCRTKDCPNRVPEHIVAPARTAALAKMRAILAEARQNRDQP